MEESEASTEEDIDRVKAGSQREGIDPIGRQGGGAMVTLGSRGLLRAAASSNSARRRRKKRRRLKKKKSLLRKKTFANTQRGEQKSS